MGRVSRREGTNRVSVRRYGGLYATGEGPGGPPGSLRDERGDADAVLRADRDDLAARVQLASDVDVDGLVRRALEGDERARREGHELAQRDAGPAELDAHRQRDVAQALETEGIPGGLRPLQLFETPHLDLHGFDGGVDRILDRRRRFVCVLAHRMVGSLWISVMRTARRSAQ